MDLTLRAPNKQNPSWPTLTWTSILSPSVPFSLVGLPPSQWGRTPPRFQPVPAQDCLCSEASSLGHVIMCVPWHWRKWKGFQLGRLREREETCCLFIKFSVKRSTIPEQHERWTPLRCQRKRSGWPQAQHSAWFQWGPSFRRARPSSKPGPSPSGRCTAWVDGHTHTLEVLKTKEGGARWRWGMDKHPGPRQKAGADLL